MKRIFISHQNKRSSLFTSEKMIAITIPFFSQQILKMIKQKNWSNSLKKIQCWEGNGQIITLLHQRKLRELGGQQTKLFFY